MTIKTDTDPRWFRNLERVFEFTFKLSFILVAILSSYLIWMLLFGWALLPEDGPDPIWNGVRSIILSSPIASVLTRQGKG